MRTNHLLKKASWICNSDCLAANKRKVKEDQIKSIAFGVTLTHGFSGSWGGQRR